MLALLSVWVALLTLLCSAAMVIYRPAFTDISVALVLVLGAPGAIALAGMVLLIHRHDDASDPGVQGRRLQAKVAIGLAVVAAAIVYTLIIASRRITPIEG